MNIFKSWLTGDNQVLHNVGPDRISELERLVESGAVLSKIKEKAESLIHKDATAAEVERIQRCINTVGLVHPTVPVIVWFR